MKELLILFCIIALIRLIILCRIHSIDEQLDEIESDNDDPYYCE